MSRVLLVFALLMPLTAIPGAQALQRGMQTSQHHPSLPFLATASAGGSHALSLPFLATTITLALLPFAAAAMLFRAPTPRALRARTRVTQSPVFTGLAQGLGVNTLYHRAILRPTLALGHWLHAADRRLIDGALHGIARLARALAVLDNLVDSLLVDGLVNLAARSLGVGGAALARLQTGRVQTYVQAAVVGVVLLVAGLVFLLPAKL